MTHPNDKRILEEAVRLFLELEAAPEDRALQRERDTFLARGEAERAAYRKAVTGWTATGIKPRRNRLGIAVAVAILGAAALYGAEPLRIALLADVSTGLETAQGSLTSGDRVYLDAGTAIIDATAPEESVRAVTVLRGAAFFDVRKDARPFRVSLGEILVEAVGTAFETSIIDDSLSVEVAEGVVRVTGPEETWQLQAGERLHWSGGSGTLLPEVAPADVASWRQDQLTVQNMPVAQLVDILDRRIAGDVVVVGNGFAGRTVSGSFDLSDPTGALEILAATQDARIVPARPFATLLIPRN